MASSAGSRQVLVVFVTCPTLRHARMLARAIVQRRLAACINLVPNVQSVFRWRGRIDHTTETLLLIKTTARGFERLRGAIRAQHPYDVPEIIALPVTRAHRPYLDWVIKSVPLS